MKNRKFQTIDDKIELLMFVDYFNKNEYDKYMELKKIRNKIIHKGERVNRSDAENYLNLSTLIIKKILGFNFKVNLNEG